MTWDKIEKPFSRDSHSVAPDSSLAKPCPSGWITSIQIVNDNRCCTHVSGWFEPKNSGWFGTHRARSTQARDSASPPKKQKNNPTTKGYAKPFCSDGGSVILSTLITAPQAGLHPPCLLVFLISLSFFFASSRWNNFPLPSQRQHRLWRNRNPMKIKEIQRKGYEWIWQVFWLASLY